MRNWGRTPHYLNTDHYVERLSNVPNLEWIHRITTVTFCPTVVR